MTRTNQWGVLAVWLALATAAAADDAADGAATKAVPAAQLPNITRPLDVPVPPPSGPITCCADTPTVFYFAAGAQFLSLDSPGNQPVVINDVNGATILGTGDLDFGTSGGTRLAFGFNLNACTTMEVSYFGLNYWDAGAAVFGVNNLNLPEPLGSTTDDFFQADFVGVETYSRFNNAEANLLRQWPGTQLELVGGFRWTMLDEEFNINSFDLNSGTSDYRVRAENDLFGVQLGARWHREIGRLRLESTGMAALMSNDASQRQRLADIGNTVPLRDVLVESREAAFVGQLGVDLVYRIQPRWVVRGGYQAMWIEGIARAADQLDFSANVNLPGQPYLGFDPVIGGAFLHGPHINLETCW